MLVKCGSLSVTCDSLRAESSAFAACLCWFRQSGVTYFFQFGAMADLAKDHLWESVAFNGQRFTLLIHPIAISCLINER